jgi:hypothetical protein
MNIKIYHDLKSLEQKMQPLVGQLCWQARLGYGDELCLEFGERIPYNSPLLEDEFKGEWQWEHLTYAISINTYGQKNKTLNFIELYQKKK